MAYLHLFEFKLPRFKSISGRDTVENEKGDPVGSPFLCVFQKPKVLTENELKFKVRLKCLREDL